MTRELDPSDVWSWWRLALEDPARIGSKPLVIHPGEPHCGYFRILPKGGNWLPVGIYPDEEHGGNYLYAERDGKPVPNNKLEDLWVWCCRHPVSYEAYQQALNGGGWEDEPPLAEGVGDVKEVLDPVEALRIEFDAEAATGRELLDQPIREKADADRAAIVASKLLSIKKRADTMHTVEKAPILRQGRDIDEKYRDLREQTEALARLLKEHQESWLLEQERIERERVAAAKREEERKRREAEDAQRRADEERRRAEAEERRVREAAARAKAEAEERERRAAAEAERLAKQAARAKSEEAKRIASEAMLVAERDRQRAAAETAEITRRADAEAERIAEAAHKIADAAEAEAGQALSDSLAARRETEFKNPQAGRTHQKVKLVSRSVAIIEDIDALFAAIKGYPEVQEWLQALADRAARSGFPLAGTRIVKERRAR